MGYDNKLFVNKKAQLTAILLIAFVLLATTSLYFLLRGMRVEKQLDQDLELIANVPNEIKPIVLYVQACLEKESLPALKILGLQGGYLVLPEAHLKTEKAGVAYLYDNGNSNVPSIEEMQLDLDSYMEASIAKCTDDFKAFKSRGFNIVAGKIESRAEITKENVVFNLNYPVSIKIGDSEKKHELFRKVIKLRLGYMQEIVQKIVDKTIQNPDLVDLTYLKESALEINILPHDINSFIYSVSDNTVKFDNKPYTFLFAVNMKKNFAPEFEMPSKFAVKQWDNFTYKINARDLEGDAIAFKDNTPLFDISSEGEIKFKAVVPGDYDVTITVTDAKGNYKIRDVKFVIEEASR